MTAQTQIIIQNNKIKNIYTRFSAPTARAISTEAKAVGSCMPGHSDTTSCVYEYTPTDTRFESNNF